MIPIFTHNTTTNLSSKFFSVLKLTTIIVFSRFFWFVIFRFYIYNFLFLFQWYVIELQGYNKTKQFAFKYTS